MAIIKKDGGFMTLPISIKRNNPIPIDPTSIWYSYDEMAKYAVSNKAAYVGQILGLVDETNKNADAYIILNTDGELMKLGSAVLVDNKTLQLAEDGSILLKNYGIQYYKYISATGSEETGDYIEAHYELQIVDNDNPWIVGLEPKVALEDDKLVLAWYEPNPTTIDSINSQVSTIQTAVADLKNTTDELQELVGVPANAENNIAASGIFKALNEKANSADVYTKEQTDTKIGEAIASADHLKRKIVSKVSDIEDYIAQYKDAQKYIFMVPTGTQYNDDKYDEYIVIENEDKEEIIEKVGAWEVDLSGYAKKTELESKVDKQDGYRLISETEIETFSKAEENIISSVGEEFTITPQKKLILNIESIDLSKNETIGLQQIQIQNINSSLTNLNQEVGKNKTDISLISKKVTDLETLTEEIKTSVATNKTDINLISQKVLGLENSLSSIDAIVKTNTQNITALEEQMSSLTSTLEDYVLKEDYELDINELRDLLTWKEIN